MSDEELEKFQGFISSIPTEPIDYTDYQAIVEDLEKWLNRDDLSYVETQLVLDELQELKEKYK